MTRRQDACHDDCDSWTVSGVSIGPSELSPTPTDAGRRVRRGDFRAVSEALDYAGRQRTGINIHSLRGELVESLTYAALSEQARQLAAQLLAAGLEPGDRVALAASSDGDFLRLFFACQYACLVPAPLPLPAPFGGKEAYLAHIRRMLISAKVSAAFAPPPLAEWFEEAAEGMNLGLCGAANFFGAGESRLPKADPDGLCYIQFSSGSTRFPLGVAVTQKALMANVSAICRDGLNVTAGDRAVSWLPLYHDMGLVGMLLSGVACQCSVDLLPTGAFVRRPSLWLELISSRQATISYAPTFGYELAARRAQAANPESLDLTSWRVAGVGGDMIRPAPLKAFAQAFSPSGFSPSTFVPSYGMAETTLGLTLAPLGQGIRTDRIDVEALERTDAADPRRRQGARTRDFALCGRVLPGHQIEVRDRQGNALAERRIGRIFASGPSLMTSYFGEPHETARVLSKDGWLDTGDLGYALGEQIVITGRAKDLIIINGRNVWPQDLEWTAESEIPALRSGDVAVFSVNGAEQERVVALVQCRMGAAEAREDLRAQTAGLFRTRHGLETEVVLIPPHSLPQTSSGKLSRSSAKSLFLSGAFEARTAKVDA